MGVWKMESVKNKVLSILTGRRQETLTKAVMVISGVVYLQLLKPEDVEAVEL